MHNKNEKILRVYIFIVLYSSLLKLVLGRWGTIVSDIATVCVLIMSLKNHGKYGIRLNKTIRNIFILVVIVQLLSIAEIFNPNIQNTLYSVIEYRKSYFQVLSLLAAYWIYKKSNDDMLGTFQYIGNISAPIIFYGIKQYFLWGDIDSKLVDMTDANFYTMYYGGHMRSVSIFSGPFHYGMFCAFMFAIYVFLFSECRIKSHRRLYLVLAIFSVAGSVCSITRTSLVCIIICLGIWFLLYLQKKKNTSAVVVKFLTAITLIMIATVIVTGVVGLPFANNDSSLGRMLSSLGNLGEDNRFMSRTSTWTEGIQYVIKSPIFGYGMGAAADTMSSYNISNIYLTSHSMYIKMFMEIGVIGGIIYLSIFLLCAKKIIKKKRNSNAVRVLYISMLSTVLLNGLVGSTIPSFPSMTIYWIITGILLAQSDLIQTQLQKLRQSDLSK